MPGWFQICGKNENLCVQTDFSSLLVFACYHLARVKVNEIGRINPNLVFHFFLFLLVSSKKKR